MADQPSLLTQAASLIAGAPAQAVADFEKSILQQDSSASEKIHPALSQLFPQLNCIYEKYETELEQDFSARLLSTDIDARPYALYQRFLTLISNEVSLAGLKRGDHIAMIGSGPFPISAILLYDIFGINVVAVERNEHAAALSRQVVKRLGLEKGIHVETAHGQDFPTMNVSSAIIALLAKHKDAILQNIFKNGSSCASVICRTSHGLRQALYHPADPGVLSPYHIRATHFAAGDQTISSILLER